MFAKSHSFYISFLRPLHLIRVLYYRKCRFGSCRTIKGSDFPSYLSAHSSFGQVYSEQKGCFYLKNIRFHFIFIFICDCKHIKKRKQMSTFPTGPHAPASSPPQPASYACHTPPLPFSSPPVAEGLLQRQKAFWRFGAGAPLQPHTAPRRCCGFEAHQQLYGPALVALLHPSFR